MFRNDYDSYDRYNAYDSYGQMCIRDRRAPVGREGKGRKVTNRTLNCPNLYGQHKKAPM